MGRLWARWGRMKTANPFLKQLEGQKQAGSLCYEDAADTGWRSEVGNPFISMIFDMDSPSRD